MKLEKKRFKVGGSVVAEPVPELEEEPAQKPKPPKKTTELPKTPEEPWYKNPEWVRAIVAIASLIVALAILTIQLSK